MYLGGKKELARVLRPVTVNAWLLQVLGEIYCTPHSQHPSLHQPVPCEGHYLPRREAGQLPGTHAYSYRLIVAHIQLEGLLDS